jgi:hypothetical protein
VREAEKVGRGREAEHVIWRKQELRAHDLTKVGARSPAATPPEELEHHPLLVLRIDSELKLPPPLHITYGPGGFVWRRLVLVASMIVRYKCITQAGHYVWLKWPTNVSNCLVLFIYSSFSIFTS